MSARARCAGGARAPEPLGAGLARPGRPPAQDRRQHHRSPAPPRPAPCPAPLSRPAPAAPRRAQGRGAGAHAPRGRAGGWGQRWPRSGARPTAQWPSVPLSSPTRLVPGPLALGAIAAAAAPHPSLRTDLVLCVRLRGAMTAARRGAPAHRRQDRARKVRGAARGRPAPRAPRPPPPKAGVPRPGCARRITREERSGGRALRRPAILPAPSQGQPQVAARPPARPPVPRPPAPPAAPDCGTRALHTCRFVKPLCLFAGL